MEPLAAPRETPTGRSTKLHDVLGLVLVAAMTLGPLAMAPAYDPYRQAGVAQTSSNPPNGDDVARPAS